MRIAVERFRHRADLIQLHEQRVADMLRDALLQNLGVRDEDVVTYQLDPVAERACQQLPSRPVRFAETVLIEMIGYC